MKKWIFVTTFIIILCVSLLDLALVFAQQAKSQEAVSGQNKPIYL
jgi:hypothetical protein